MSKSVLDAPHADSDGGVSSRCRAHRVDLAQPGRARSANRHRKRPCSRRSPDRGCAGAVPQARTGDCHHLASCDAQSVPLLQQLARGDPPHGDDVHPLSLRQVEDLLFERGIDICHETVRFWWNRFGPVFAAAIRKRRVHHRSYSGWRWHLDEVFVKINGERHYLWRAVDHEGGVLEVFATKRRDRRAALKFLTHAMKHYSRPRAIVTDRLRSYGAAMRHIGVERRQVCGRWLNNRAENSHQPALSKQNSEYLRWPWNRLDRTRKIVENQWRRKLNRLSGQSIRFYSDSAATVDSGHTSAP